MKIIITSLILFLSGWVSAAPAGREHCLPAQEVTRLLQEVSFEGGDRWTTEEVCNPERLTYQTLRALIFIKNLELPAASSSSYPDVLGTKPWTFFTSRIREINFPRTCQEGVLAFVFTKQPNIAHVCPALINSETSAFAATLLHEARHADGFSHVLCSHGDIAGAPGGCDQALHDAGSYGLEIEWGFKLAKSDKIGKIVRDQSRSSSVYLLLNRLNEYPLDLKEGLALQALNGEITFFDGQKQELITTSPSAESVLTNRVGTPVFFNSQENSVLGYYFSSELSPVPGLFAQYLTSKLRPTDKESLLDIDYEHSLFLFKDKIVFFNDAGQFIEARHGISKPRLFSTFRSFPPMKAGVYVTDEDGALYKLPEDLNSLIKTPPEFISRSQTPIAKIVQDVHNTNYALLRDGSLVTLPQRWGYSPVPIDVLQGQAFKNFTPTLWSPLLEDL